MEFLPGALVEIQSYIVNHYRLVTSCALSACGFLVLRRWMQGGVCRSKVKLDGKTVLITGANTGIGRETARDLAKRGARVILACRDLTRAERAADDIRKSTGNGNVLVYQLDLASLQSVRKCAEEVKAKEKRLDILINNAGLMGVPAGWTTKEGYEMHFGVNYLGHFLLTNLLLDLLKSSAPSRIVNVSSLAHAQGKINFDDLNLQNNYNHMDAYSHSKLAQVLFTRELAKRLKGTRVTTYVLHPGAINTEISRNFHKLPRDQMPVYLKPPLIWVLTLFIAPLLKTVTAGAQTTIYCAVSEDLEGVSGKYYSDCREKQAAPQAQDDSVAAKLWTISEQMAGLKS